jgi:hypothetical protein
MIDAAIRRAPTKAISKELPHPGSSPLKATAVAETFLDGAIHVAYLAKSSVYIYKLDVNEQSASLEREVLLPQPHGWQGIAIAGNFLAAWGFYSHERQVGFWSRIYILLTSVSLMTNLFYSYICSMSVSRNSRLAFLDRTT